MSLNNETSIPDPSETPGEVGDVQDRVAPGRRSEPPGWKPIASKVCLGLFVILAVLSLLTTWAAAEMLNTDRYVDTVSELAEDPDVQEAVANRISSRLIGYVDSTFQGDDDADDAGRIASLTLIAVDQAIQRVVLETVQSDAFLSIWTTANEVVHPQVVALLRGEDVAQLSTTDGQVAIDLAPVVVEVQSRLEARGISILDGISTEPGEHMFVLFESDSLESAQAATDLLITARWVLLLLTLVTLILTIVFAEDKGKGVISAGLGLAVAMVLALVGLSLGERMALDRLDPGVSPDVVESAIDIIVEDLRAIARILAVSGLVIAAATYVILPGTGLHAAVERFVIPHRQVLYGAIIGVGCLAIVLVDNPIGSGLVLGLVVGVVAIGVVWWIGRDADQSALAG